MSIGDPLVIEESDDDGNWSEYLSLHCLSVNKTRSSEYVSAGGEQNASYVTFRVRWNRFMPPIETDTTRFRIVWRENIYDIRGYDDFKYQHRKVDIMGVSR